MSRTKNRIFTLVKWLVLLVTYGFLIYKLANISYWNELNSTFRSPGFGQIAALICVLMLMPVNWMLEAQKWQLITSDTVSLTYKKSLQSVLAGLNTGFITPNRIGDFAGRILYLSPAHRTAGIALSLLNSLTQNIVLTFFGIAGGVVYFSAYHTDKNFDSYLMVVGVLFSAFIGLYFAFPGLVKKINTEKWAENLRNAAISLSLLKSKKLVVILGVSVVRFAIFCLQFYLMLRFFDIEITALQALSAIPVMYLLITFTPSLAAAEPAIRGSAALLIFSVFSSNEVGIILTGILIWLINFVIPMLAGSVIVGVTRGSIKSE